MTDVIEPKVVADVRHVVESIPGVVRAGPALIRKSGDMAFADVTLVIKSDTSFDNAHKISKIADDAIKKQIVDPPPDGACCEIHRDNSHRQGDDDHAQEKDHKQQGRKRKGHVRNHDLPEQIKDVSITVHLEPDQTDVPINSQIMEIVQNVGGEQVKGTCHVGTYSAKGKLYADLHVHVDGCHSLSAAYDLFNKIKSSIKESLPEIERTTIHLKPFNTLSGHASEQDIETEDKIRALLKERNDVQDVIRVYCMKSMSRFVLGISH